MKISDCKTWHTSSGKAHMLSHLEGQRLTQRQAILANCASCMAGYSDGRYSCESPECPLFPYMPYRKHKRPVEVERDVQGELET